MQKQPKNANASVASNINLTSHILQFNCAKDLSQISQASNKCNSAATRFDSYFQNDCGQKFLPTCYYYTR